jgi:hypothetical protein
LFFSLKDSKSKSKSKIVSFRFLSFLSRRRHQQYINSQKEKGKASELHLFKVTTLAWFGLANTQREKESKILQKKQTCAYF